MNFYFRQQEQQQCKAKTTKATENNVTLSNHQNDKQCQDTRTENNKTPTKEELKARLSPIQFQVTQCKATERPFSGQYNKFNQKGFYHCVVCDELLFSSSTKFDSGCGWPAFWDSIDKSKLKFVQDASLVGSNILLLITNKNLVRTEVLCKSCDSHLGHIFDDGPKPTGKRYCINSASLYFKEDNNP